MGDPRCGTSAGYMAHRYVGEEPCEDCLKGHAARIAEHRRQHGRHDRLLSKARSRALDRLRKEHPVRFRELYEQAKVEVFAEARTRQADPGTAQPSSTEDSDRSVPETTSDEGTPA